MKQPIPFWQRKTLDEMTPVEWEALCDGCGICCLYKVEDANTGKVQLTNIACRFLDLQTCRCIAYPVRKSAMPTCIQVTPQNVHELKWLPHTCAYRCLAEGKPLPWWHPLISSNPELVHTLGISVRGRCIHETNDNLKHLENYIVSTWKKQTELAE